MNLSIQRRMASDMLKCGYNRVWIDPTRMEDVSDAVTRSDVRMLIKSGAITAVQKVGVSRGRARKIASQKKKGRQRGAGSREGTEYARFPRKRQWIQKIRPIRALLREFRNNNVLDKHAYRLFYRRAKGGMFNSRAHLIAQLKVHGIKVPEKAAKSKAPAKKVQKTKVAAKPKAAAPAKEE